MSVFLCINVLTLDKTKIILFLFVKVVWDNLLFNNTKMKVIRTAYTIYIYVYHIIFRLLIIFKVFLIWYIRERLMVLTSPHLRPDTVGDLRKHTAVWTYTTEYIESIFTILHIIKVD